MYGVAAPASAAIVAICSESVSTITSSTEPLVIMLRIGITIIGPWLAKFLMFLFGMRLLPPRAITSPTTLEFVCTWPC